MATIAAGAGRRGARTLNYELPLLPLIDFLLCLILFLLAIGNFQSFARLQSNANVPSQSSAVPESLPTRLHVEVEDHRFRVTWRAGAHVLVSSDVPLQRASVGGGVRYPELAAFVARDWLAHGVHQRPDDLTPDQAVVHVRNSAAYEDVIAVIDALRAPQRRLLGAKQACVFAVSFAAD
jgi:biopolymer transport protein ExbD